MKDLLFRKRLKERWQSTILGMSRLGFITWVIGVVLMIAKVIPCNSATEFGIYTGSLIAAVGWNRKLSNGG